jgi:hypothetical protein
MRIVDVRVEWWGLRKERRGMGQGVVKDEEQAESPQWKRKHLFKFGK